MNIASTYDKTGYGDFPTRPHGYVNGTVTAGVPVIHGVGPGTPSSPAPQHDYTWRKPRDRRPTPEAPVLTPTERTEPPVYVTPGEITANSELRDGETVCELCWMAFNAALPACPDCYGSVYVLQSDERA